MVRANNDIRLKEIQSAITTMSLKNIQSVSISTIARVLKRCHMSMKHLYLVPFERNNDRVKELRYQNVNKTSVCIQ